MKVYWFYYKSLLLTAVAFSLFLSITNLEFGADGGPISIGVDYFGIKKFVIFFATIGFGLAALLNSYFYKHKSYMYYNLGYSPRRIFIVLSIVNLFIMSCVCVIL